MLLSSLAFAAIAALHAWPTLRRPHPSMNFANDRADAASQALLAYASHMSAGGAVGATVYAREAGSIQFGGNAWYAPWLEVGRVSADGDEWAGLLSAARVQRALINRHVCMLHPLLAASEQTEGIELGLGARWSELRVGSTAIILVDECAADVDVAAADTGIRVGFAGFAANAAAAEGDPSRGDPPFTDGVEASPRGGALPLRL